ncbi:hypothetical protein FHS85_005332 [Rhodoligotrophos appendicifer]|uniref:hypothetical protein n=1 Tax=Rhodoligotrophos appendicifer TaxID=987056 RepID=UPI001185E523|nr:hypothetical protein [Rhodoligotrophos appendicifer]
MQELFVNLIIFLLVEPMQQEIARTLADSRAPQEVVAPVLTCATEHGPKIVNRALTDPRWAASSVFGAWIGLVEPAALLAEAAPGCASAIGAAQPFLETQEGSSG